MSNQFYMGIYYNSKQKQGHNPSAQSEKQNEKKEATTHSYILES